MLNIVYIKQQGDIMLPKPVESKGFGGCFCEQIQYNVKWLLIMPNEGAGCTL